MQYFMIGVIIFIVLVIADGLATFIPAICRNKKEIEEDESLTNAEEKEWFRKNAKELEIISEDGLKLKAYEFLQPIDSDRWVILIHGYRIDAISAMSPEFFFQKGWNVLCPDLRAHGKSTGKYIGMGWQDRKDMLMWIHKIVERNHKAKIVLYGGSLGGTTAMMTVGEVLPNQVKCAISDSGFTSAWDLIEYRINSQLHLPAFPTLHLASIISKIVVGFSFKEASAIKQLEKCSLPMLFIHGTADQAVPFEMLDKVYHATKGEKQKLVFEGAGHVMSYRKEPERYWKEVFRFIEKYIG